MKKFVFLADLFAEDYVGGAELTTQALIEESIPGSVVKKFRCSQLSLTDIDNYKDCHWVVCNFSHLAPFLKLHLIKSVEYSMVEYDYKFCVFRSLELHKIKTGKECDCAADDKNKVNLAFYGYAKKIWFMSDKQRAIFLDNVRTIKPENTETLNSVFSRGDLNFITSLKDNPKDETYLIVKSNSWVKGYNNCLSYAKKNNLKHEVVSDMHYHELLIKLSTSKGLIFLPDGADTCPRLVMEAQMLGCDLVLNDLVQHKDEDWAQSQEKCFKHIENRASKFWSYYEEV